MDTNVKYEVTPEVTKSANLRGQVQGQYVTLLCNSEPEQMRKSESDDTKAKVKVKRVQVQGQCAIDTKVKVKMKKSQSGCKEDKFKDNVQCHYVIMNK